MHRQWKDEVEFLTVYMREAHPVGDEEKATPTNAGAGILVRQPKTLEERQAVAKRCTSALRIEMPLVVDGIDNRVSNAYQTWPDRLYVVDREGRIAYRGGPGPFGFNPSEMEQALLLMLIDDPKARLSGKSAPENRK